MLVHRVQVFAQRFVHARESVTHLDHLLLDALSILLTLLLAAGFEKVVSVFSLLILTDSFQLLLFNIIVNLFHGINIIKELAHELFILLLLHFLVLSCSIALF